MPTRQAIAGLALLLALAACNTRPTAGKRSVTTTTTSALSPGPAPKTPVATPKPSAAPLTTARQRAEVGRLAPDFQLTDLDGKAVTLSDYRGKVVVLEWFNPGCPYVKLAHTKGSLVGSAARHAKEGVVWLAINSGAPGKQGHGLDANRAGKMAFAMNHPVLLDESGRVGRLYGAERTPHLFVIDTAGVLVYAGAVDNSPDGEGEAPSGGKLINYVDAALGALRANRPVEPSRTKPYGCSVKYGS